MTKAEQKAFEEWWEDNDDYEYFSAKAAFDFCLNYTKNKKGKTEHFEEFWTRYPTKVKKKPTLEIWKRKNLDKMIDIILLDLNKRITKDLRWLEGYIPDPTTYLNQERWTDEIQEPEKKKVMPKNNEEWLDHGKKLGIEARVGESMVEYKRRLSTMRTE